MLAEYRNGTNKIGIVLKKFQSKLVNFGLADVTLIEIGNWGLGISLAWPVTLD